MIKLCLEILLQFTHEEEKELCQTEQYKTIFYKVIYATSCPSQFIFHKWVWFFFFMLLDEIKEGFTHSRKESHVWKIEYLV